MTLKLSGVSVCQIQHHLMLEFEMLSSLAYIQCCPDLLDLSANVTEKRKGRVRENAAAATLFTTPPPSTLGMA